MSACLERFGSLFDLQGRVAVVTGAAQGNGSAISNALVAAGADVVAVDLAFRLNGADTQLNEEITDRIIMDVSNEENVKAVFENIVARYGHLDILVNNAGIMYKAPVDKLDIDKFRSVLDVNLNGVVVCTKQAVSYMKQQRWGRIVNISSSQAYLCTETYSAYSASKAAVSHLTRIWGRELAPYNVLVNALCPSFVMTPMMAGSIDRIQKEKLCSWDEAYNYFAQEIPLKRIMDTEEVGNWAVVLCSDLARATTGNNFAITCGQVSL